MVRLYATILVAVLLGGASGYAAAVIASRLTLEALAGGQIVVTGSLVPTEVAAPFVSPFSHPAAGTSPGTATEFSFVCGTATPGFTEGNWVFEVFLLTTTSTPASATFRIVLNIAGEGGFILFARTGSTVALPGCLLIRIDLGTEVLTPLTWHLVVTRI